MDQNTDLATTLSDPKAKLFTMLLALIVIGASLLAVLAATGNLPSGESAGRPVGNKAAQNTAGTIPIDKDEIVAIAKALGTKSDLEVWYGVAPEAWFDFTAQTGSGELTLELALKEMRAAGTLNDKPVRVLAVYDQAGNETYHAYQYDKETATVELVPVGVIKRTPKD